MPFMLAFGIIAIAVMVITYRTYVGYKQYGLIAKLAFLLFLILSMLAPFICYFLHHRYTATWFAHHTVILYFLFGFVFILFLITLVRDIIWTIVDVIRRKSLDDLKDTARLKKVNLITFIFSLLVAFYGFYEANKVPNVVSYDISSDKIKQDTKLVMLSDLHINIDTPPAAIKKIVNKVNELNPDVIVLVGDMIDNMPNQLNEQMDELAKLKASQGIYFSLGNHEFYTDPLSWGIKFGQMGFYFLNNYGINIGNSGLFIAGIPDIDSAHMMKMPIKIPNALYPRKDNSYVVLLSHSPKIAEDVTKDNVDLQLSAHTHGGQIFPFHFFVKKAYDGRLAGFYNVDGVKMYISRGTRYWGAPMRLLAPSEITVFNFKPEKTHE